MPAPSKNWTVIADGAVDSDSPIDQALMTAVRDNLVHLEEWLGFSYTAAQDHDHDNVNSKSVVLGNGVVTWGKLSTGLQQQTVGLGAGGSRTNVNFTGGGRTLAWGASCATSSANIDSQYNNAAYVWGITFIGAFTNDTLYFQANYINSSPPWDLGDGDVPLFIFAEMSPEGRIVRIDAADAPPWAYNGPTDITPDFVRDGKKYQVRPAVLAEHANLKAAIAAGMSPAQFMERIRNDEKVEMEISHAVKNADMDLIPHPFGNVEAGNRVILIDPVSKIVHELAEMRNGDPSIGIPDLFMDGLIHVDNQPLNRAGPPGVMVVSASWKLTQ